MTRIFARLAAAGAILLGAPGHAEQHAAGADLFVSADADDTEVYRAGLNLDISHQGPDHYLGLRYEHALYRPLGRPATDYDRAFLRWADRGGGWAWAGQIGTDGHTLLGSAGAHDDSRFRKEIFVERDIVETPRGVGEGIYYTFAGAAIDLPADSRNSLTLVGGVQAFTGRNERLHLRATLIHSLKPDWGLSLQLRARYFLSTTPGELDYYSPRWYAQALPVVQLRRYSAGWRYLVAAGYGAQRDSNESWRPSRFLSGEVSSPENRGWLLRASVQYSNTPLRSGVYDYVQGSIGVTRRF